MSDLSSYRNSLAPVLAEPRGPLSFTGTRAFPDYNGWHDFECFQSRKGGSWYWQPLGDDGEPRGYPAGPWATADEAQTAAEACQE